VALDPDAQLLLVGTSSGMVVLLDSCSGTVRAQAAAGGVPSQIAVDASAGRALVLVPPLVRLFDIPQRRWLANIALPANAYPQQITLAPETHQALILNAGNTILWVVNTQSGRVEYRTLQGSGKTPSSAPPIRTPIPTATPLSKALTVTPLSLTFGPRAVNTSSAPQTITLQATGGEPVAINTIQLLGGTDFGLNADACAYQAVEPGATCKLSVTFMPTAPGPRTATIIILDDTPPHQHRVDLSGTGTGK
jgi:hypothetical protein